MVDRSSYSWIRQIVACRNVCTRICTIKNSIQIGIRIPEITQQVH